MSFQRLHAPESTSHTQEPPRKHRKMASEGSGRAWTEEEETYLLQTRQQKMPYKHIAAHLGKTELACRLHHHHLSQGTNRRKRAQTSPNGHRGREPTRRNTTSTPPRDTSTNAHASTQPKQLSPEDASKTASPPQHMYHLHSDFMTMPPAAHPALFQPQPQHHHPLVMFPSQISRLPTPPTEPFMVNANTTGASAAGGLDASSLEPDGAWFAGYAPKATYMHLPPPSASTSAPPPQADMDRLHAVYDAHRNTFLAAIASAQGVQMGGLMTSVLA